MKKRTAVLTVSVSVILVLTGLCCCKFRTPQADETGEPSVVVLSVDASTEEADENTEQAAAGTDAFETEVISFSMPVIREGKIDPLHALETCLVLTEHENGSFTAAVGGEAVDMDSVELVAEDRLPSGSGELRIGAGKTQMLLPPDTCIVIPGYRYMALQELISYNEDRDTFSPLPESYVGIEKGTQ